MSLSCQACLPPIEQSVPTCSLVEKVGSKRRGGGGGGGGLTCTPFSTFYTQSVMAH